MPEFAVGDPVTKPGYGYYGRVVRLHRKYRTDWVAVLWVGSAYTVDEYPRSIQPCPVAPERIIRYN